MSNPIYKSDYNAAQIEAAIGKGPRVNASGYWEVWNVGTMAYVSTGVGAGVQPPTVVTQVSQMTNHGYIYIYEGSEDGYTPGYFYYWNGSAWTAGGAYRVAATDPTLSVAGAAADAKAVGEFKSALQTAIGNEIIDITWGYYITTNGSTVNINSPTPSTTGWGYAVVDAAEGDVFIVNSPGASTIRAWCFIDASGNSLSVAGANVAAVDKVIVAPANTAKLVINTKPTSKPSFRGRYIKDDVQQTMSSQTYDEYLINDGSYTIQVSDLESGQWSYSTKATNAARARTKHLLPVRAGMQISYANTTFDTFFGVLETPTSSSYIQTPGWKTDGSGTVYITRDGYLTFIIRNHADNTAAVDPATYNSTVTICTETKLDTTALEDIAEFTCERKSVSYTGVPQSRFYITSGNQWGYAGGDYTTRSYTFRIPDDTQKIIITGNAANGSLIAFLNSYSPEYLETPDFSSNYPARISIAAGITNEYIVDADMKYLYATIILTEDDKTPSVERVTYVTKSDFDTLDSRVGTLEGAADELKSEIDRSAESGANAVDILSLFAAYRTPRTRNGLTIDPTSDGGYHVYGTTTADLTAFSMWDKADQFPVAMRPGETYRLMYSTDNTALVFRVYVYKQDAPTTPVFLAGSTINRTFTIPDDAVGVILQLAVSGSDVTIDSVVHPKIYTMTLTNDELNSKIVGFSEESLAPYTSSNAVIATYNYVSETVNGVEFSWDNGVCTINGQATETTLNFLRTKTDIPAVYQRGVYHRVLFTTSDDKVSLRILFRDASDTLLATTYVTEDTYVLIPADATVWSMGLYINDTTHVFNDAVVSDIAILTAETNDALAKNNTIRYYTYQDMQHGKFYHLALDAIYFRDTERLWTDAALSCLLIPVKKGDSVFLGTYGGASNAKSYAVIPFNRIISDIGPNNRVRTTIQITTDGWLAINCKNANSEEFFCRIESEKNKAVTSALFSEAYVNDRYIQFPAYDDDNPCRVLRYGSTLASMIHHWGIIGASSDCGESNYTVSGETREIELYEYSPWACWQRMNGIPDVYHYCDGGQNAKEWISLGANTTRGWAYTGFSAPNTPSTVQNPEINGAWSGRSAVGVGGGCWWKMKQDHENGNTKQAFIIHLGGNDINLMNPHDENWNEIPDGEFDETRYYKCGTIDDIGTYDLAMDTDTVPAGKTAGVIPGVVNSFAAYVGAVLNRILAIQPDAKIFYLTVRNNASDNANKYNIWLQYNDCIRQIAAMDQYKNNVYIVDDARYGVNWKCTPVARMWVGYHLDVMGYKYWADYLNTLIDYVIQSHYTEFKQTMFIGSDKRWTST